MGRPEERERDGGTVNGWDSHNTHNLYLLSLDVFYGSGLRCLKNITIATSNITDHHKKYDNRKIWTMVRIIKMWDRTQWTNAVGKMVLIDLLYSGCPRLLICKIVTIWRKGNKVKCMKGGPPYYWSKGRVMQGEAEEKCTVRLW